MRCSTSGIKTVSLVADGVLARQSIHTVTVADFRPCFSFAAAPAIVPSSLLAAEFVVRVRVVDPDLYPDPTLSFDGPLVDTEALAARRQSVALTNLFRSLGESPVVLITEFGEDAPSSSTAGDSLTYSATSTSVSSEDSASAHVTFNSTGPWWEARIRSPGSRRLPYPASFIVSVSSLGVSVLSCSVAQGVFAINVDGLALGSAAAAATTLSAAALAASPATPTRIGRAVDQCVPSRVVAIVRDNLAVYSLDAGLSWAVLPGSLLGLTPAAVYYDVSLAGGFIHAATSEGLKVFDPISGALVRHPAGQLPANPAAISGVATLDTCVIARDPGNTPSSARAVVLAWSAAAAVKAIYFSHDFGATFARFPVPSTLPELSAALALPGFAASAALPGLSGWEILTALPLFGFRHSALVVLGYPGRGEVLLRHFESTNTWAPGALFLSPALASALASSPSTALLAAAATLGSDVTRIVAVSFSTGSGEILMGGNRLVFTPDGGVTAIDIPLLAMRPEVTGPALGVSGPFVAQISCSSSGTFALLNTVGQLFFGESGLPTAREIASPVPFSLTSLATVFHSVDNQAMVLIACNTASSPSCYPEPARSRTSALPPGMSMRSLPVYPGTSSLQDSACPYAALDSNVPSVFYLDMLESFSFWVSLTPRPGFSNAISSTVSDYSLVRMSSASSFAAINGILTRNQTFTVTETSGDFTSRSNKVLLARGLGSLIFSPLAVSGTCPKIKIVTSARIGCPPKRHLRYEKGPKVTCPRWENAEYTVPGGSWNADGIAGGGSPGGGEKRLKYNVTDYGCPVRVAHDTAGFRPGFAVYDGDVRVRSLDVDYVALEINGRTDYSFNATERDAGCLRAAQTYKQMRALSGATFTAAWDPATYRSCFVPSEGRVNGPTSAIYEVINSTGVNGIRFLSNGRGGIFVFEAKVIDPDYSHCELKARFALNVVGTPLTPTQTVTVFLSVVGIMAVCFYFSYIIYKRRKLKGD